MFARRASDRLGPLLILAALTGCGSDDASGNNDAGGGGTSGSAAGGVGASSGSGGANGGGSSNSGGTSSGGSDTGGANTGGANSGGANSGGANTGGANSGGASTGGSDTGGAASGGAAGGGGTNTGGGGGSASRAYKGVANSACADLARLNVAWWYNWTLGPGGCDHDEFVPMISGKNEKTTEAVSNALSSLVSAGYRTVLGFNEPNKADQANMSVEQVLDLWPALTANAEVKVGSPATSADAQAWFSEFMAGVEARSLRVDFVAIHWYGWNAGSCNDARELENYVRWAESFERPIWITEWGCLNQSNPSREVVTSFYSAAIAMFENHPLIERYAWYPWTTNNELVDDGGALTPLGDAFSAAPALR